MVSEECVGLYETNVRAVETIRMCSNEDNVNVERRDEDSPSGDWCGSESVSRSWPRRGVLGPIGRVTRSKARNGTKYQDTTIVERLFDSR